MNTIFEHRSVRSFSSREISDEVLQRVLLAASRASTVGNMQLYSLIVTRQKELREQLSPCHFNQPMVKQAPVVITVCADVHRFSAWCEQRGAEPAYDNFMWFVNSSIDAVLASQNLSLAAESEGLGICYLGTTLYTTEKIIEILNIPSGVIPVTTIVMGYPEHYPSELTDRLPLEGVVHYEQYQPYTEASIDEIWFERERSEETLKLLEDNNLPNLARIFTERRYTKKDNLAFSDSFISVLKKQGFLK